MPIDKEACPYRFEIVLGAEIFEFEIRYNERHDFFTVDLFKDGETLVLGERLTYGIPLFRGVEDNRFPIIQLIPFDEAGKENRVSWDNLGKTVFLAVVE
ncbi:hypothetical protein ACFCW7_23245 [Paenibacillus glucanolyticus]|uniref:phage baseplate plug family protein n=1 Tax=Paenibacillus glucanolyticus TaxID=59843 RepID=UPI0035DACEBF